MLKNEHLEAHNLFNRLLSIDEENQEVQNLLDQMYQNEEHKSEEEKANYFFWAAPLLAVLVLSIFLYPKTDLTQPNPEKSPETISTRGIAANETFDDYGESLQPMNLAVPATASALKDMEIAKPNVIREKIKKKTVPQPDVKPQKVSVKPNKPVILPETEPEKGTVVITVPYSWADVIIDGKELGRTGNLKPIKLAPGTHCCAPFYLGHGA